MKTTKALINPDTLVAARHMAGIDLELAASALEIDVSTLISWEKGEDTPYFHKLLDISDLYDKGPGFFYLRTKDIPPWY